MKQNKIVYWGLTALLGGVFIMSAMAKLFGGAQSEEMASQMGLSISALQYIAIVEVICAVLFIIPRTGVVGTLLMAAYMGGAIAVHVVSGQDLLPVVAIETVIWLVAAYRFPELTQRLLGKN